MTTLTQEQLAVVTREVAAMMEAGDLDETWRVLKMFADGRFNFGLGDLPSSMSKLFGELGSGRRKEYQALLHMAQSVVSNAGAPVLDVVGFGMLEFEGQRYELVKIVSKASASPYASRLPICLVAGVHGDEPDGILAAMEFARRFAASPELVSTYSITIYPCINPVGYERMTDRKSVV